MSNTGSDAGRFVTETKFSNHSINISQSIQADGWYLKNVPGGIHLVSCLAFFFRGKIIRGKKKFQ